ncbi:MAG TPA: hypothetical protein VGJ48_25505, partial [Pyrinomonadaceae bacterium]
MAETEYPEEEKLKDLLFHVRRSIRYHDKRRGFLEGFQKTKSLVAIVVGSAAMVTLMNSIANRVLMIAALAVGILSAIDLVFGVNAKAREHSDLRRRFIDLEKEIIGIAAPTASLIREMEQKRRTIEADEPSILRALDAICHNEQLIADGYAEGDLLEIKGHQRLFAH